MNIFQGLKAKNQPVISVEDNSGDFNARNCFIQTFLADFLEILTPETTLKTAEIVEF